MAVIRICCDGARSGNHGPLGIAAALVSGSRQRTASIGVHDDAPEWFDPALPTAYHALMNILTHPALARVLTRAKSDPEVLAVLLFGSRARGDGSAASDFDVCLVLRPEPASDLARAQKRLEYLAGADLDIAIFQQLPLYIQSRVLKEGTVLFVRDEDALYELATRTARAFERFRPIYRGYLEQVSRD